MNSEKSVVSESAGAALIARPSLVEETHACGAYTVECIGADGQVKWTDSFPNLVTTVGKNEMLDKALAGVTYTAAWYLGLVTGPGSGNTYLAANTASSHAGWTEAVPYSNSTRPAASWSAASGGAKSSTATSFTINASATVAGAFLINDSTKSGTTGVLFSVGNFSGGDRTIASGDTLNVTYTATLT